MTTVPLKEAKELLEGAAKGEKIVIIQNDGSTFELVPALGPTRRKRGGLGRAEGRIWMADDFDAIPEGFENLLP